MFGFFRSKRTCPIESDQRQWIDARFRWLTEQFGADHPAQVTVVLPTPEFFPDPFEGRPEDVAPMFARIARYMGLDPDRFDLCMYADENREMLQRLGHVSTTGAAGWYAGSQSGEERPIIGVEFAQLSDPVSLVATLAHEAAHELLLGERRISADEHDHEPLTDLLTVFKGFGVFTANSTIRDRGWSDGTLAGWSTSRHGYLNQRMLGYALARFAAARRETNPTWIKHVRPDVRAVLVKGLRFLEQA